MRDETVKCLTELLCEHSGQVLLRDDYDELARTSLSVLGEIPPTGIKWMKPGSNHKARFMADVISRNKMYAFHPSIGYEKVTVAALRRVVQVNGLLYVPQFLKASIGADALVNLHFVQQLLRYMAVDRDAADAALKVLRRHGWFLTQEMVVF